MNWPPAERSVRDTGEGEKERQIEGEEGWEGGGAGGRIRHRDTEK